MEPTTYSVESIDVLLICALYDEYKQVCLVTDGITEAWVEHIGPSGNPVSDAKFLDKENKLLTIRATWADHMGGEIVQALVSKLILDQPTRCIAMSGICAGRCGKVALGDVIFAERLWRYDVGKIIIENGESKFEADPIIYRPKKNWVQRMQTISPLPDAQWLADRPKLPLEHQEIWVLLCILDEESPQDHDSFKILCPNWRDVLERLLKQKWLDQSLNLTSTGREKAKELKLFNPKELPELPTFNVHVAPIATGPSVIEDSGIFPRLSQVMRKVLGIEMEGSAIAALGEAHDIPVVVAKGVSDYGVSNLKDDFYRDFAARASAECLISLLRQATDLFLERDTSVNLGLATVVQESVTSLHNHLDEIGQGVEKLTGIYKTQNVLADYHSADATLVLQGILKRRASFGQDTIGDLQQLINDMEDNGKFCAAPTSLRIKIYEWIARVAASRNMHQEAEKAIKMVSKLGGKVSVVVLAWFDVVQGDIDAGLKRLRNSSDAESQSNIFGILRSKRGNDHALAYFEAITNKSDDIFTAIGWKNVIACLVEAKRVKDAANIYITLPTVLVEDCPSLGFVGGMVCAALLVPVEHQYKFVTEELFSENEHLVEGTEVDQWRVRAHDAYQLCANSAIDADDSWLEKSSKRWLRWLNLIDPVDKQEAIAALIDGMKDGKEAVNLISLAVAFKVKFDPVVV